MVSKASPIVIKNDELEQELLDETSTGVGQTIDNADQTTNGAMTTAEFNSMSSLLDSLETDINALQTRVDDAESQADGSYASAVISGVDFNLKNYCMGKAITQIQFDYNRVWGLGANDGSVPPNGADYLQKIANTVCLRILNPVTYKEMGMFYFPECSFMDSYMMTAKYQSSTTESGQGPLPIWPSVKAKCNAKISKGNFIVVSYYTPSTVTDYKLGTEVLEASTPTIGVCIFEIQEGSNMLSLVSDTNNRDDDYSVYEGSNTDCFTDQNFFDINSVIIEDGTVIFENRSQCLIVKHDQNTGDISLEAKTIATMTQNGDGSPADFKVLKLESDPLHDSHFFALYGPANAGAATDLAYKEYSTVDNSVVEYDEYTPITSTKTDISNFSYAQYCSLHTMRVCGRYIVMAQSLRSDSNYESSDPDDATLQVHIIDRENVNSPQGFNLDNSSGAATATLSVAPTYMSSIFVTDEGDIYTAVTYEAIRSNVESDIIEPARSPSPSGNAYDNTAGFYRIYKISDLNNGSNVDGRLYEFSYRLDQAIDRDETKLINTGWRVYDHLAVNRFNLAPDTGVVGNNRRNATNILPVGFLDMGDELHLPLRTGVAFGTGEYIGIIKIEKLSNDSISVDNQYIGFPNTIDERRFDVIAEKLPDSYGTIGFQDPEYSRLNAIEVSSL